MLSRIPALTLADSYRLGDAYDYGEALGRAADLVLGPELALEITSRLWAFQDLGLERLGDRAPRLRERFERIDHPAAREIVAWLDGRWAITAAEMEGA